MKAIILAAGRGSRMKSSTTYSPKCMTYLEDKTLIEWQISALQKNNIEEIIVVGGYRIEILSSHLSDIYGISNIKIIENPRWNETNMVASLLCAMEHLSKEATNASPIIISYSDIVYHPNIIKEIILHGTSDICITYDKNWHSLWSLRFENPLMDAETFKIDNNGYVLEIGKRPNDISEVSGQYMGLLFMTQNGLSNVYNFLSKHIQLVDKLDMTTLLARLIGDGIFIKGIEINGKWCEVDNQNDLEIYSKYVKNDNWSHNWL